MTIYLYTGTPGSGKSYNVARDICRKLSKKTDNFVLANFAINTEKISFFSDADKKYNFEYFNSLDLKPTYFVDFFKKNLKKGKENQALIVIDEAQLIFNSREWQSSVDRMGWIQFFSQHRKFGYNIILVTQNDRMIDRQIRSLAEYEVVHRKINNFKMGLLPFTTFISIKKWYGIRETVSKEIFIYRKKIANLYDSYQDWERLDLQF